MCENIKPVSTRASVSFTSSLMGYGLYELQQFRWSSFSCVMNNHSLQKEMSSERTNMENRIEELEDGLENIYFNYRTKHPGSKPLSSFPAITPFNIAAASTDEMDGLEGLDTDSASNIFNGVGPVTSITSLPCNLQGHPHLRQRGERLLTNTWQPPTTCMVDNTENSATKADSGSLQMSPSGSVTSISALGKPHGTTHHLLYTTPPSSPPRPEPSTSSPTQFRHSPTSSPIAKRGMQPAPTTAHTRPRADALSKAMNFTTSTPTSRALSQSMYSAPPTHRWSQTSTSSISSCSSLTQALSQPLLPNFYGKGNKGKGNKDGHRNSLPLPITTTIFEGTTSGVNNPKINTTRRTSSPGVPWQRSSSMGVPFRQRSSSSGNFQHSLKSQLLMQKTSPVAHSTNKQQQDTTGAEGKQDTAWFEDF